ncbi:hypothetical protein ACFL9T_04205 [Thermodesulfobacteriota bacterium]
MASNFKVLVHQNSNNLHLKLIGDFDGDSAHQVINLVKRHCPYVSRVFIHTSCLKCMLPFGRDQFINHFRSLKIEPANLVVTGDYAPLLSV